MLRSDTFYFLRYAHVSHVKSLFTNIQKQENMLKTSMNFYKIFTWTQSCREIFKSALVYL